MLAFIFASQTFAFRRLAKGLCRSHSEFSSFSRDYLDKVSKTDQCAHCVDDIGIAGNNKKQLCANIRTVFDCLQNAVLKLTMSE